MKESSECHKTYKLSTIHDIFEKVPVDRIRDCMTELAELLVQAKAVSNIIGIAADVSGRGDLAQSVEWPEYVTWVDDGEGEIVSRYIGNSGDELFGIKLKMGG